MDNNKFSLAGVMSPTNCKSNNHMCADRSACVPNDWKCDGEPDCDDGSDEVR